MGSQLLLSQRWHFSKIKAFISAAALVSGAISGSVATSSPQIIKNIPDTCIKLLLHPETCTSRSQVRILHSTVLKESKIKLYTTFSDRAIVNPGKTSESLIFYLLPDKDVLH